jgi:hypothetical protein
MPRKQEKEGDQQPSELPILGEKDNSLETSGHVPLVSETNRLRIHYFADSNSPPHHRMQIQEKPWRSSPFNLL